MKAVCAILTAGLSFTVSMGPALAQSYGYPDYDYGYRHRDDDYRDRYDYRDDYRNRYDYRDRGPRYRIARMPSMNASTCAVTPMSRRAVRRGEFQSGLQHYLTFGRREGRALSC